MEGTLERERSRGMKERLKNGKEWVWSESERGRGGRESGREGALEVGRVVGRMGWTDGEGQQKGGH